MKKNKKFKGSVLVVSLLVLAAILIVALSVAMVTLNERKVSMGETKSNAAFQNAQTGVETLMTAVNDKEKTKVSDLYQNTGLVCNANERLSSGAYEMELTHIVGGVEDKLECSVESGEDISQIAQVIAVGNDNDRQRAIKFTPECYGAAETINGSNLVGRWKFDGDETTTGYDDEILSNHAIPCTTGLNNHINIDSSPIFDNSLSEMPTGFIKFNDGANVNCAMISHRGDYELQDGTVSFWVRYHNDEGTVFSKDADGCWEGTEPDNTAFPYGSNCPSPRPLSDNNSDCDCGHLTFSRGFPDSSKDSLQIRFQNDGNGSYEFMETDAIDDGDWHLSTMTFSGSRYIWYIDGELDSEINYGESDEDGHDPDSDNGGIFEAMLGNKWHIWLGGHYKDNPNGRYAQADMDDLRIYDKVLSKCEIVELYRKRGGD